MSTPSEYVMFRSAIHSDQAFKKIGSATMVARSKWCKSFQKWLFLTIVLWRAPSSAAYSIHFTNSSLKALSCKESGILSAIEKKIFGKNIICKTSEGATRSRTKSRGANPASRPSARTHIQTENSTLSNRVFFCIIILLRTLVFLPFLHTILLWYFFVLLDFPNVLGFWICVFALDDDFASSLGSSIFEKCWVTLLVALWFSNVLGFWIRLFVCSGWCFSWLSWFFDFPWLFDFENSSN